MSWKSLDIDDNQLVTLCRRNDRKAQNFLFEKYKKKVLFICMRYASNRQEAKDTLQEAFINIFKSLVSTNENIKSLPAWIHRITTRTSIDVFRRKRTSLVFMETVHGADVLSEESTPIEKMQADELLNVIQKMPEGYRVIFNLYVIEGYDHHEISEMLAISQATSRSQLTRAKDWLKKRLSTNNLNNYERLFG